MAVKKKKAVKKAKTNGRSAMGKSMQAHRKVQKKTKKAAKKKSK